MDKSMGFNNDADSNFISPWINPLFTETLSHPRPRTEFLLYSERQSPTEEPEKEGGFPAPRGLASETLLSALAPPLS